MVQCSFAHCKEIMKDYHDGIIYVNCGHFAESLCDMIEDEHFIDSISDEQLRMFKNYASIALPWRKKERRASLAIYISRYF